GRLTASRAVRAVRAAAAVLAAHPGRSRPWPWLPWAGSATDRETPADPARRRHTPTTRARRCRDVPGGHAADRGMTHRESRRASGNGLATLSLETRQNA